MWAHFHLRFLRNMHSKFWCIDLIRFRCRSRKEKLDVRDLSIFVESADRQRYRQTAGEQ